MELNRRRVGVCDNRDEGRTGEVKHFMELVGAVLAGLVALTWAVALILAGPALLKLCISYLFF